MSKIITLRKGLDINLRGKAQESLADAPQASEYALSPLDFEGVTPKLLVKVGDEVKAGTPLFFNKYSERVLFTSPVSGTVAAVNRGEKRKVLSVTVTPDASVQSYEEFAKPDLAEGFPRGDCRAAAPVGPLADDRAATLRHHRRPERHAESGLHLRLRLRAAGPGLQLRAARRAEEPPDRYRRDAQTHSGQGASLGARQGRGADALRSRAPRLHAFAGKHPVGNVGVQIHHIDPVNKGEVVWTVNIQDLAIIGRLFNEGRVDMTKIIAVAGSEIEKPQYCRIVAGAKVDSILKGNVKPQKEGDHVRIISGNVLTGTKTAADGFIGFYANQLTVIPEGDKYELLGWAMPRFNKFSVSRAYFSWLCPKKAYNLDTNMNGGERPFVVTGLYEQYLPMDIYPMYLLKACLAGDIDKMENLGIYEVAEEDFALCEFVDPSKIEIQQIIRDGINLMIREA